MECVQKKYDIIYADPPWKYRVWDRKGTRSTATNHYPTLSIEQLSAMDIAAISSKNCVLLMWATFPCLKEALCLGKQWGFKYKTVAFVWVKQNLHGPKLFVGMGHYTRANSELVLLFTKGKALPRKRRDIRQVLISPRGRHSEKPPEIRKRIENLFGKRPRIELFARRNAPLFNDNEFEGWDLFGNEVQHSIVIASKSSTQNVAGIGKNIGSKKS